jgi:protein SPT2
MTSRAFAALMALSQAQTQESTRAADSIQAERRRKEEARRRQQEEEDRKERERQAKMLLHRIEEQKREKERQEKQEREREAQLKEIRRREEEQRKALLYGPKRAKDGTPRHPTSSATGKRTTDDGDETDAGLALTREEKRERRLQLQFSQNAARRAGFSAGTSRVGRQLPGGAVNVTALSQTTDGSAGGSHSVRARLTAMPNTLTKLNTVKRDTRTIDEILRDRARARENKTLEGEEAREFHDWFGTKPTTGMATKPSSPSSPAASGASTPSKTTYRPESTSSALKGPSSPRPSSSRAPSLPASKPTAKTVTKSSSLSAKFSRPSSLSNKATSGSSVPCRRSVRAHHHRLILGRDRIPNTSATSQTSAGSFEWHSRRDLEIFGRDRSKYVARDVVSDDEDMEADVVALQREEFVRYVASFLIIFSRSQIS